MGAIDHLRPRTLRVVVQALQENRVESIIRIGERHPIATRLIQALVTHRGQALILGVIEHAHALIRVLLQIVGNQLRRMIRGAVNHDQKLKIGVGLRQHRLNRRNDGGSGVVDRHNDARARDGRHERQEPLRTGLIRTVMIKTLRGYMP